MIDAIAKQPVEVLHSIPFTVPSPLSGVQLGRIARVRPRLVLPTPNLNRKELSNEIDLDILIAGC